MRPRLRVILLSLGIGLLTLIPYGIAYAHAGEFRFTGFLFNPYDAASYLAKMRQGSDGQLLYTLAFTDNPGPGALIFTYYLLLGRLARLLGAPLIAVWHAARILGGAFFLAVAWEFFGRIGLSDRGRRIAWSILLFGSGFGFLVVPFGSFTADLWVAEYIPFLGIFTNAHFPLAMALILLLAMQIALPARRPTCLSLAGVWLLSAALASTQPFGFLPLGLAISVWTVWNRFFHGRFPEGALPHLAAAAFGVLPWAVYDLWMTRSLPRFAVWFAQNQTPTPPVWDIALSLGLPGIFAGISFVRWMRIRSPFRERIGSARSGTVLLGLWLSLNLILLYAPFPLQRRLLLGMWIPLAALAAPAFEQWLFSPSFSVRRAFSAGIPLCLSNAVFLTVLLLSGLTRTPQLFLSREEAAAVDWLDANAQGSVVLAPPELSKWLPGMAGVGVIYGHPMETPEADTARSAVDCIYGSGSTCDLSQLIGTHRIQWIVADSNWKADKPPLKETARFGDITVWRVKG
jgi:hypothetical protein